MKQKIYLLALLGLSLASCMNDIREEEDNELYVDAALEDIRSVQTRSVSDSQNGQFVAGKLVDVFLSENATSPTTTYIQPLKAKTMDANGTMEFKTSATDDTKKAQYWPTSGNGVNVYGWYPAGKVGNNIGATSGISFSVVENQTDLSNYQASDLMFGMPRKSDNVSTANPVARDKTQNPQKITLRFEHLLSKITINLQAGGGFDGTDKLKKAVVTIPSVNITQALTNLKTGALGSTSNPKTITLKGNTTDDLTCYAVIPPQVMTGKVITIKLTDSNGTTTYNHTIQTITFAKGKEYIYNMKVTSSGLEVTSTVTTWTTGATVNGDALIQ